MNVYDIVFYFNEENLLEQRIEYLKNVVHKTIVFNFGFDRLPSSDSFFEVQIHKSFESFIKNDFKKTLVDLISESCFPEDILVISKTFEIPSLEVLKVYCENYFGTPKKINHDLYFHNVHLKSKYKHIGSSILRHTDFIITSNLYDTLYNHNIVKFQKNILLEGGFALLNFDDPTKSLTSLKFWFSKLYGTLNEEDLSKLVDGECHIYKIPRVSKLLKINNEDLKFISKNIERPIPKNIFVEIGIPYKIITDFGIKYFNISIPKDHYYESEEYEKDFLKNELLVILKNELLNDEDNIILKTKTVGDSTVFKYKDLKNSIPSDIIGTSSF
jgi:hypothetical protein